MSGIWIAVDGQVNLDDLISACQRGQRVVRVKQIDAVHFIPALPAPSERISWPLLVAIGWLGGGLAIILLDLWLR